VVGEERGSLHRTGVAGTTDQCSSVDASAGGTSAAGRIQREDPVSSGNGGYGLVGNDAGRLEVLIGSRAKDLHSLEAGMADAVRCRVEVGTNGRGEEVGRLMTGACMADVL
jgi:hypothetical protein